MTPNEDLRTALQRLNSKDRLLVYTFILWRSFVTHMRSFTPKRMFPIVIISEISVIVQAVSHASLLAFFVGTLVSVAVGMFPILFQPGQTDKAHWVKGIPERN